MKKINRVAAIIALCLICIAFASMVASFINSDLLNGGIKTLSLWSYGIGGMLFLYLYLTRTFPMQKVKREERERAYLKKLEQEEKDAQNQDNQDVNNKDNQESQNQSQDTQKQESQNQSQDAQKQESQN